MPGSYWTVPVCLVVIICHRSLREAHAPSSHMLLLQHLEITTVLFVGWFLIFPSIGFICVTSLTVLELAL